MNTIDLIRKELNLEAEAIRMASGRLNESVETAIRLLQDCAGKIVVTGMGKTGIIARKVAATLASTGSTAIFLHAAEGLHGDLGMLAKGDVVIAISNTGNTQELISIIPYMKFLKVPIIAFTGNLESRLADAADVVIDCGVPKEYEPLGLVPTSSTTVALAMGDAIAIALLRSRAFSEEDYARFHPGGTIGKKLLLRVGDLMHSGERNPVVRENVTMQDVIMEMTAKGLGCTGICDETGKLLGIITDGDLRRILQKGGDVLQLSALECMTANPKRLHATTFAVDALNTMEDNKITMLPVVDGDGKQIGMLHMHDLIQAGVV